MKGFSTFEKLHPHVAEISEGWTLHATSQDDNNSTVSVANSFDSYLIAICIQ
jgi:hypothetical protein